jgi:hypothetical protein
MVGRIDTRATNQVCSISSRHANGGLNMRTNVSMDMAKKSPTARTGFKAPLDEATICISPVLETARSVISYAALG